MGKKFQSGNKKNDPSKFSRNGKFKKNTDNSKSEKAEFRAEGKACKIASNKTKEKFQKKFNEAARTEEKSNLLDKKLDRPQAKNNFRKKGKKYFNSEEQSNRKYRVKNSNENNPNVQRVDLHPISIKLIKEGHPWITADAYTKKFPKEEEWLIGRDKSKQEVCLFFQDSEHKQVKGRVWTSEKPFTKAISNFEKELKERVYTAFEKRGNSEVWVERDNYYLIFGEGDRLPGLFVQKLGKNVLVQFYSSFWNRHEEKLFTIIKEALKDYYQGSQHNIWLQQRKSSDKTELKPVNFPKSKIPVLAKSIVSEFGVKYLINIGAYYDMGIYSDMSAIRKQLRNLMGRADGVLNLYSYTGAFSLYALQNGAKNVVSVDLSPAYIEWLENNLKLNSSTLNLKDHTSICASVKDSLKELSAKNQKFELVICDPPSASSDGKKRISALQSYEEILPELIKRTKPGGHLVVFLNTHKVKLAQFRGRIKKILETEKLAGKVKIERNYQLREDCPQSKDFPEGSYLKGLLLKVSK